MSILGAVSKGEAGGVTSAGASAALGVGVSTTSSGALVSTSAAASGSISASGATVGLSCGGSLWFRVLSSYFSLAGGLGSMGSRSVPRGTGFGSVADVGFSAAAIGVEGSGVTGAFTAPSAGPYSSPRRPE